MTPDAGVDGETLWRRGGAASGPVRTPDQRLRIFVSCTLGELA